MDAIFSPTAVQTAVQIVGTIIVLVALLQVAFMFYSSWRRVGYEKAQRELSLELLRKRVEGETPTRSSRSIARPLFGPGYANFGFSKRSMKEAASARFTSFPTTESRCRRSTRVNTSPSSSTFPGSASR